MQARKHKAAMSNTTDSDKLLSFCTSVQDYVLRVWSNINAVSTERTDSKKYAEWDGLGLICDDHFNFYHQVKNKLCYCLWQISRSTSLSFNHLQRSSYLQSCPFKCFTALAYYITIQSMNVWFMTYLTTRYQLQWLFSVCWYCAVNLRRNYVNVNECMWRVKRKKTTISRTNQLTPCYRVLDKIVVFTGILRKPKVRYHVHKSSLLVFVLARSIHSTPSFYFLRINFNIIAPYTPWSSKLSPSLRFPKHKSVCIRSLPHTWHMVRPSHSSWFDHPINIWWGAHIMKLLSVQFPQYLSSQAYRPKHPQPLLLSQCKGPS